MRSSACRVPFPREVAGVFEGAGAGRAGIVDGRAWHADPAPGTRRWIVRGGVGEAVMQAWQLAGTKGLEALVYCGQLGLTSADGSGASGRLAGSQRGRGVGVRWAWSALADGFIAAAETMPLGGRWCRGG